MDESGLCILVSDPYQLFGSISARLSNSGKELKGTL